MRVVAALGGNAIQSRDGAGTAAEQRAAVAGACRQLAGLVVAGHELVVTHGNGPQVGALLVQQRAAEQEIAPMPLDVLDAQTQGQLGYLLAQQLGNALRAQGLPRPVAAVVTQVVVDPADPAFGDPDKPVGPHYTETELEFRAQRATGAAGERAAADCWLVDGVVYRKGPGGTWRRVVPSPRPVDVVEADTVRRLLAGGVLPVCGGGGGCPVARDAAGALRGVEAVVDKDRTAALLTGLVDADLLLVLTDVDAVCLDYGSERARPLRHMTAAQARHHLAGGQFPAGSMGPKVEAAAQVAEHGGRAVITSLGRAAESLAGASGTVVEG